MAKDNFEVEIKKQMKDLNRLRETRKRKCEHKPRTNGQIVNIHDSKFNVPNKKELPETTVICTGCEKYFEGEAYYSSEIDSGLYMFTSMAEQVKVNANLSEEDKVTLESYYEALDTIAGFSTYYLNMVEKLSNGNKHNGKKPRSQKGHMGVNSNMYNRGY